MTDDIYNDGTYISQNPSLHEEDSEYKFVYIKTLLEEMRFAGEKISILDVGGGSGMLGLMVCEYFAGKGLNVAFTALDLSSDMLAIQKKQNPYITRTVNLPLESLRGERFDLALMIDVIEHIPEKDIAARQLNGLARYVIYNIPTEINLFDLLRNIYLKGNYYRQQTASLGHVHFFSKPSALDFIRSRHRLLKWTFPDYCSHVLTSPHGDYEVQRKNRLRFAELVVSRFIFKYCRFLAPYLVQGSVFCLAGGTQ